MHKANFSNDKHCQEFGITVQQQMVSVTGRVLPPPKLVFGGRVGSHKSRLHYFSSKLDNLIISSILGKSHRSSTQWWENVAGVEVLIWMYIKKSHFSIAMKSCAIWGFAWTAWGLKKASRFIEQFYGGCTL